MIILFLELIILSNFISDLWRMLFKDKENFPINTPKYRQCVLTQF